MLKDNGIARTQWEIATEGFFVMLILPGDIYGKRRSYKLRAFRRYAKSTIHVEQDYQQVVYGRAL